MNIAAIVAAMGFDAPIVVATAGWTYASADEKKNAPKPSEQKPAAKAKNVSRVMKIRHAARERRSFSQSHSASAMVKNVTPRPKVTKKRRKAVRDEAPC